MADSPYASPESAVGDAASVQPASPRPPRAILVLVCAGLDYVVNLLLYAIAWAQWFEDTGVLAEAIAANAIVFGCGLFIYLGLIRGRNWARFSYTGFAGVALSRNIAALLHYALGQDYLLPRTRVGMEVSVILELYVVVALFTPSVRTWYQTMKER